MKNIEKPKLKNNFYLVFFGQKISKIKKSKHAKNYFFCLQKSNQIYSGKIFVSKKNRKVFDPKSFREENQGGG